MVVYSMETAAIFQTPTHSINKANVQYIYMQLSRHIHVVIFRERTYSHAIYEPM